MSEPKMPERITVGQHGGGWPRVQSEGQTHHDGCGCIEYILLTPAVERALELQEAHGDWKLQADNLAMILREPERWGAAKDAALAQYDALKAKLEGGERG